jgi:cytochrome c oxidase subunit 4
MNEMSEQSSHAEIDPHEVEHIKKHVKFYIGVFLALLVLTAATVGVAKLIDFDAWLGLEGHMVNYGVGLLIATAKASLVALFFMHLSNEKWTVYRFLIFTVIFAIGLMGLFVWAFKDIPKL